MVGNDRSLSAGLARRKVSSALTASISVRRPRGASTANQARKFVIAAPSRSCAAREPASSAGFFFAFMSVIGSAPMSALPPARSIAWVKIGGRGPGVEGDACALPAKVLDKAEQSVGLEHVRLAAETVAAYARELSPVQEYDRTPLTRQIGPAKRQRRIGDVRAANIEQPRQIVRIADQETLRRPDRLTHARNLRPGAFARESELVRRDRANRRRRPIRPDRIDRVLVDRDQPGAGLLASGRISRDSIGRMEPRVIAKLVACLKMARDPFGSAAPP